MAGCMRCGRCYSSMAWRLQEYASAQRVRASWPCCMAGKQVAAGQRSSSSSRKPAKIHLMHLTSTMRGTRSSLSPCMNFCSSSSSSVCQMLHGAPRLPETGAVCWA